MQGFIYKIGGSSEEIFHRAYKAVTGIVNSRSFLPAGGTGRLAAPAHWGVVVRMLPVFLGMVLWCTVVAHPVWAEDKVGGTTVQGPQSPTVKDSPLASSDTSSPRSTLQGFLESMTLVYDKLRRGEPMEKVAVPYYRAKRSLNLSEVPPAVCKAFSEETAIKLKEFLDRVEIPPFTQIPGSEEVSSKKLTRWNVPGTDLTIAEVTKGPRKGEFLFSPQTVARIDELYRMAMQLRYRTTDTQGFYDMYLSRPGPLIPMHWVVSLPLWARTFSFGHPVWKWIGLGVILLVGAVTILVACRWGWSWHSRNPDAAWQVGSILAAVSLILVPYAANYLIGEGLLFSGTSTPLLNLLSTLLFYFGLGWISIPLLRGLGWTYVRFRGFEPTSGKAELAKFTFWIFAVAAIVGIAIKCATVLGLPAYSIVTSLGFGGIAFALAAKDTVANFIGGVVLLLDHPFKIGDYVDVANAQRGEVIHVGPRTTRILTRDDVLVSVPNATIVNETISNESGRHPRLRVRAKVGVAYGSDFRKVESILLKVAQDNPLVMGKPEPRVRFREFGDSSLNFELLCWTADPADRGKLTHQLNSVIYDEFNKSGVVIPFPQRDVHLVTP